MMKTVMARSNPITLSLPPFSGATRRLILINVSIYFGFLLLHLIAAPVENLLLAHVVLNPAAVLHGQIWQLVTYAFVPLDLLSGLFAMLTIWFVGGMLEGAFGSRWLYELYFTAAIGGALIGTALCFTRLLGLDPVHAFAAGPRAGIYGLLIAIAMRFGDSEFLLFFVLRIKAKYMVAIYIVFQMASLLTRSGAFDVLVLLCGALSGFLYVRSAPRKGLSFAVAEHYFSMRNEFYRNKRRNAARKFEVYMRKQNREVHFDSNGRYIEPDETSARQDANSRQDENSRQNENDKRWMN